MEPWYVTVPTILIRGTVIVPFNCEEIMKFSVMKHIIYPFSLDDSF